MHFCDGQQGATPLFVQLKCLNKHSPHVLVVSVCRFIVYLIEYKVHYFECGPIWTQSDDKTGNGFE